MRNFTLLAQCNTVATAHTLDGLNAATMLKVADVDVVEVRLDALATHLDAVERLIRKIRIPVLITARHPAEGGIGKLSASQRAAMYHRFLPYATLLDIELRSASAMKEVCKSARTQGVKLVLSHHNFKSTPPLKTLLELARKAATLDADIFKVATMTSKASELARLVEFANAKSPIKCATMGMGKFGQVSRLTLALAGSVLNYGYLHKANAPGQWEARELKALLKRLNQP
jgi:3-dehydroquinate dehydratase I